MYRLLLRSGLPLEESISRSLRKQQTPPLMNDDKHPMNNEIETDEYYRIKDALLLALGQTEEIEQTAAMERALAGLSRASSVASLPSSQYHERA
jgi:hypothetical protein